ncbi:MAG: arylamine N-acetyltransferase [Spirochaetes bacterium]|nr:arylamine N-acetyltransferase [Spirochaetota bacterium]
MMEKYSYIDSYLERINYKGSTAVSEETLRELHIAHTLNVPFENIDVFYKQPVLLDENSLFEKIVNGRRGGYCFEMNGIFSIVLKKLGFRVTDLLARGTIDGINYSPRTHQALMVETGNTKWIADVGFGNDGIIAPLLLEDESDQKQFAHTYRIISDQNSGYLLQKKLEDNYNSLYKFTLEACTPEDFLMSNHFTSTFPQSFFLMMRMCTMPTKEGRITLTDKHFKIISNGNTTEKPVANEEEFKKILNEKFSLDLEFILQTC